MEQDSWPGLGTAGKAVFDDDVLNGSLLEPRLDIDVAGLANRVSAANTVNDAVYKATKTLIKKLELLHDPDRMDAKFKADVQAAMETIKKTPKGQLRSSLRDEVVFVAFFKMTKDAFALMERFLKFDNKNMRPKFDEVRQKVLQQIQRLFSNKIHNVHLEQSHLLPDLEKQEELYALLLPKLKETHGRFKKL